MIPIERKGRRRRGRAGEAGGKSAVHTMNQESKGH